MQAKEKAGELVQTFWGYHAYRQRERETDRADLTLIELESPATKASQHWARRSFSIYTQTSKEWGIFI